MKLSEAEWAVLNILWSGRSFSLKEITTALQDINGWNKNTVYTYLTRMEKKGLVAIERSQDKPYSAAVTKEYCAKNERTELLDKVYGGATGDLIAAFLKESTISSEERNRLKKMLDEMEV
ncbi:MAG: BlaI/MecI/CopY family transcriptional regulator [Agathobacter sp.]|nr:BlaI/MecI/CopY family transcriptional regulator [Agathobacter sp.]MBQ3558294.1 BlaI/MecI/CopY family transcriptional regulator [Agathobacter sp.]